MLIVSSLHDAYRRVTQHNKCHTRLPQHFRLSNTTSAPVPPWPTHDKVKACKILATTPPPTQQLLCTTLSAPALGAGSYSVRERGKAAWSVSRAWCSFDGMCACCRDLVLTTVFEQTKLDSTHQWVVLVVQAHEHCVLKEGTPQKHFRRSLHVCIRATELSFMTDSPTQNNNH